VETALGLLEAGEYDGIQMRDVAERANVAIGTVYRYFSSKEHLFAAVLWKWTDLLQTQVERQPLDGDTPGARLDALFVRVLAAFARWPQFLRMVVVVEGSPDPNARQLFMHFVEHNNQTLRAPLGDLSPEDAQDVVDVVQSVMGTALRSWAAGMLSMDEVHARISRAIDLIFSAPPRSRRRRA
jgi:TetR/AcrR family transcriptional regulator, cholesterol catabolism regulator